MRPLNVKVFTKTSIVLVLVLGPSFLIFVGINLIDTVDIPDDIKDKLDERLIEILFTTHGYQRVDVIVGCIGPGYLERAHEVIGYFTVLKDWNRVQMFRAMLFPLQIALLVSQDFVWRIDYNSWEIVI